jgi:hypothetical protein
MKELICILCPNGCHLTVDDNLNVTGNTCLRGDAYARKELKIPLSDLKYEVVDDRGDSGELLGSWYQLDPHSVQNAISVRFSDIKVISVGDIPPMAVPEDNKEK